MHQLSCTCCCQSFQVQSHHSHPSVSALLKITERIEYKLLSLTYKVLTTTQPSYLHILITVQPPRSTRSSSLVTLARPSTSSSLRITGVLSVTLPLVSGINSQLPSVNQALIAPILTHPVLQVALPPSASPTHHSHHPSPFHSRLKTFSANSSHRILHFLLPD